jgi:hypothetical protein
MKKAVFLSLILIFSAGIPLNAQLAKGKLFLAGSSNLGLNAGVHKDKENGSVVSGSQQSYFNFNFQPRAGYLFINNLATGLFTDIDIYSSKYQDGSGAEVKGTTVILGPFARYYIPLCDNFIPYVEGQFGFGIDNYKENNSSGSEWDKTNQTLWSYRAGAGVSYFFNNVIGIDAFLAYNHEVYNHEFDDAASPGDDKTESLIYNEFLMQLGIIVLLDCSK